MKEKKKIGNNRYQLSHTGIPRLIRRIYRKKKAGWGGGRNHGFVNSYVSPNPDISIFG